MRRRRPTQYPFERLSIRAPRRSGFDVAKTLACVKTCSQTRNTIGGGAFLYALLVHKVATKAPAAPAATKSGGGVCPFSGSKGATGAGASSCPGQAAMAK